jgi:ssRNA-specific RNase YbeY (16S rRNA maturation enzyme)
MMEDGKPAMESELVRLSAKLAQLAWKIDDVDKKIPEEPREATQVEIHDLRGKLLYVENEFSSLSIRIGDLEKIRSTNQEPVRKLPETNIISSSLWKRMWAVFGHGLLGNIILITWVIAIILLLFGGN